MGLEVAVPLMIAGTAAQMYGSAMQGREQARAADFERQQYETQQENAKLAAAQDETDRRIELVRSIETIQALRVGSGLSLTSPGGMALLESVTQEAQDDIRTSRLNYLQRADLAGRAANMSARRARTSLLAGYLGAVEAGATGAMRIASLTSTGPYRSAAVR
jgi:hypothetical protein